VRLLRPSLWTPLLACLAATCTGAGSKPNFGGTWKLNNTVPPEIYVVEHSDSQFRIVMFVDNDAGVRTLDVKGPIDGQPHPQTVNGSPCVFTARWEGDTLYWETRRETRDGVRHNRRFMQLSADGRVVTARRTRVMPAPQETWTETWEKQDPPLAESHTTGFALRNKVYASGESLAGREGAILRGVVAVAFNDLPQAERELLPILRQEPNDSVLDPVREILSDLYGRTGQPRKALEYCNPGEREYFEQISKYPDVSVTRRGCARVQALRGHDGALILPLVAAGKDAAYEVDTGSNMSLLRLSEARRLGLKLEPVTRRITDVTGAGYEAYLAIVPTLSVGEMRLQNASFWIVDDARIDAPGLVGIDLLLQFQTLRWNSSGVIEVGFPAQERNLRQANIYFEGSFPIVEASSNGHAGLSFVLDTGYTGTHLYVPFASRFLDLVAAKGRQGTYQMNGQAGHSKWRELVVPEVRLQIGGMDTTIRDADVLVEKAPQPTWHYGCIGIDALNQAQTVTLDFQAMRLTLEGKASSRP